MLASWDEPLQNAQRGQVISGQLNIKANVKSFISAYPRDEEQGT